MSKYKLYQTKTEAEISGSESFIMVVCGASGPKEQSAQKNEGCKSVKGAKVKKKTKIQRMQSCKAHRGTKDTKA